MTCADLGTVIARFKPPALVAIRLHQYRVAADRDVRLLGVEDLFGLVVGVGKSDFVRLHLDVVSIAGGHAHVAARILDLHQRVGRNLHVQHLLI